jgi:hypothetical protein
MSSSTIVPDDVLTGLISAGPVDYTDAETHGDMERLTGSFEPTTELLRTTIDAVFWASLSEEEGKPALVRVLFVDIRNPYCQLEPRKLSATELCKLSPLLDGTSNALLIRMDAKIVGVGQWHNGNFGVVARRPGSLAVIHGSMVLGVFDRGIWVIVGGSSVNVNQVLHRTLSDNDYRDRFLKATLIVNLAMKARAAGRGAAFVVIPHDHSDGIGSVSYPIVDFSALPQVLEAWRRARCATPVPAERDHTRALVRSAVSIAAAGAGIDGATLIDEENLRLVGFGAKMNAPDANFSIKLIELPSSSSQTIEKKECGGMRHQTAARLVHNNHRATVITVSQDGPVSLFAWNPGDESVVMIRNLDRYLEAEVEFDR